MNLSIKNSLKVGGVIIGAVVGAGFASGQEILQFFTAFKEGGLNGILLAGILFSLVCISVLEYVYKYKINNYSEYVNKLAGKYAGTVIEILVMLFLLASFFIMIAGTGALFNEFTGMNALLGAGMMSALCCLVFLFDVRGVVVINLVLAPVLIGGIILLGMYIGFSPKVPVFDQGGLGLVDNWLSSAIVYVSYNSITLAAILPNLVSYLNKRKVIYYGVFFGVGALCLMALIIYFLTGIFFNTIGDSQIPMIKIIKELRLSAGGMYSIVLLAAMFTSCVSAGFCFLNKVSAKTPKNLKYYAGAMCLAALPLSTIGFSDMIKWLYPIFGYVGLFQVIVIIIGFISNSKDPSISPSKGTRRLALKK